MTTLTTTPAITLRTARRVYRFALSDRLFRIAPTLGEYGQWVPVSDIERGDCIAFVGRILDVRSTNNSGATLAVAPPPTEAV